MATLFTDIAFEFNDAMWDFLNGGYLDSELPTTPNEPAIGIINKDAFIKTRSIKGLSNILKIDKATAYKRIEEKFFKSRVETILTDKVMYLLDDTTKDLALLNFKTNFFALTLSDDDKDSLIEEAKANVDKLNSSPFAKKIKEEIKKYGHTLDTYDGQLIYKKGESIGE